MFNNSNCKKIINTAIAVALTFSTFNFASKCQSIPEAQAIELAKLAHERAQAVWAQYEEDSKKAGKTAQCKSFDDIAAILNKYCPHNSEAPKIVKHKKFEELKVGKKLLYRGIAGTSDSKVDKLSAETKNGKFRDGEENSGVFASTYKKVTDLPLVYLPQVAAENYAVVGQCFNTPAGARQFEARHTFCIKLFGSNYQSMSPIELLNRYNELVKKEGKEKLSKLFGDIFKEVEKTYDFSWYQPPKEPSTGRILSFFYDPSKAKILYDGIKIVKKYQELYPPTLDSNGAVKFKDAKTTFLSLQPTDVSTNLYGAKLIAQLLGYDAAETDDWQYQIFNTGILTFDEQDEIIK